MFAWFVRCGDRAALPQGASPTETCESPRGGICRCAASFNNYRKRPQACIAIIRPTFKDVTIGNEVPLIPALKEGGDVKFGNVDLKA